MTDLVTLTPRQAWAVVGKACDACGHRYSNEIVYKKHDDITYKGNPFVEDYFDRGYVVPELARAGFTHSLCHGCRGLFSGTMGKMALNVVTNVGARCTQVWAPERQESL